MRMNRQKDDYEPLDERQYYINNTEKLEKGMETFPSVYVEGAAACGKTTAVRMMLSAHPDVEYKVFWMDRECIMPSECCGKIKELEKQTVQGNLWVIFENIPYEMPVEIIAGIVDLILHLSEESRVILIGQDRPHLEFLKLIWKRKMELIPQEAFLFTKEQVRDLCRHASSCLNPEEIFEETGGWAGCVDMMVRMSALHKPGSDKKKYSVKALRESYEIDTYIREEILEKLSGEEQEMVGYAAVCPWISRELCIDIWGIIQPEELLDILTQKGILQYDEERKRWRVAPLFVSSYSGTANRNFSVKMFSEVWRKLGKWYEERGFVSEALYCVKLSGDHEELHDCMIRNYKVVPFSGISYDEVMKWKEQIPEIYYLRGMYCYFHQDPEGLDREISKVKSLGCEDKKDLEILLNLTYVKPDLSLEEWLKILEDFSKKRGRFSLYGMLGGSMSYLCGMRDLSALFACSRKEENRRARIWKECLGEDEYTGFCLARLEYYLEIGQQDAVRKEDWDTLKGTDQKERWQFRLAGLHLLCKLKDVQPDVDSAEYIRQLESSLLREENQCCVRNTKILENFFYYWNNEREKFSFWLLQSTDKFVEDVNEGNYYEFFCLAKGYMLIRQYDRAQKLHKKLIPYLQLYRRTYLLTECLFQQSIISRESGEHSQALRNVIETFMVSEGFRYLRSYTEYGSQGCEVLEAYIEWIRNSRPEAWHRKKKYHYGNVLRMPEEDYLQEVLRCAKRRVRSDPEAGKKSVKEKLTMMETLILQDIGRGFSNMDICEELNLKMPTVKGHIYSLYKKLNVNNRVQAVMKGKELGILK